MSWRADALEHALTTPDREVCGLLVLVRGRERYWRCRNIAETPTDHFVMHPADRAAAEDAGEVVGVVHSHPGATAKPSPADIACCNADGVPWHIVGLPLQDWWSMHPAGRAPSLLGREFIYGLADCYSLIRDWYAAERGVELPDFARADGDFAAGRSLYEQGFPAAGFVAVDGPPEPGDVLLFRLAAQVPDHGAIYLAGDRIMHHLQGRLSSIDTWDGFMRSRTVKVLRYAADGQTLR